MEYKRNQIEEAISRVVEPGMAKPSSELRSRIKRLLDTDRSLERSPRSGNPERANFAFFSMDAPGRGVDTWFSHYEGFALLLGLQLMQHGWPQGFTVAVLRRVRSQLEGHHARILKQDPARLFDQKLIMEQAKPGALAVGNTDPVFLVIVPGEGTLGPISCGICRGQDDLIRFVRRQAGPGQAWTVFELVNSVHVLSSELAKTKPAKRGRGSK